MTTPPLCAHPRGPRGHTSSPLLSRQLATAAGVGLVVGVVAHLVTHSAHLLGAEDVLGTSGIGLAWLTGLLVAAGLAVASGLSPTRRILLGIVLAYGTAFAAATFGIGPWITNG